MEKQKKTFLSMKEANKLGICQQIQDGQISIKEGSILAQTSYRQMKRIWKSYSEKGAPGLAHGNRGKKSNRAFPLHIRQKMLCRYREKYSDCGPTLAVEYLEAAERLPSISPETFRKWLKEEGIVYKKRKIRLYRRRRQRKENFGAMVQFDGSYHDWFEGRHEKCWLMVAVDDATGIIHAQFTVPEGIKAAMETIWSWVERYGLPKTLYCDRKNCYVTQKAKTVDEQLENKAHYTDFTRACHELGIHVINANSPQAKGRVERINGVLQDRLVKALRYEGIHKPEQANQYLREKFLPTYNKKFSKQSLNEEDFHRKINKKVKLEEVFCYHHVRVVQNDWSIQYKKRKFQLSSKQPCAIQPRRKVIISEQLDCKTHIIYNDEKMNFKEIKTDKGGHFYIGEKGDISIVA